MVTVGSKVEQALLKAALQKEAELDAQLARTEQIYEMEDRDREEDLDEIRRRRLEQMKDEQKRKKDKQSSGHGTYEELVDEKEFFEKAKQSERMCLLFYRPGTWRCEIVDKHFRELCRKHWNTRFCKINAEKVPYLCERLNIWCLPSVVCIKDRVTDHTIVGFSELSGDEHTMEEYEALLGKWGMVQIEE